MGLPWWALAVLVAVPLAQIPLVLLLARRLKLEGAGPSVTPSRAYWTGEEPDARFVHAPEAAPGRCGRCGTTNDPTYTFCAGCLARL